MSFTRFERARILGARALQISLGAPPLVETANAMVDPLAIATREFEVANLPISIQRGKHAFD